ncbi:hypothetical protein ACJROX_27850 [Pseudalkalibacillus sp. A8]|uniref:hypothetical protein n=1 Tax=Pseudalkalibacillus sp. A8 TaxID=3382641 RepID=UPI0038B56D93
MNKTVKILFIVFNIAYFTFDWILIPYLPNPILFGWLPLQMFLLFAAPIIAAILWGLYFNAFFNTQQHVKYDQ